MPALLTGFALAFARALGEYGSVIFIAGNMPMVSRDHAAADHHQARAVRLRRRHRDRRGDAGHLLRAAARDQPAAGLGAQAPGGLMTDHDARATRRPLTSRRARPASAQRHHRARLGAPRR
jgi:hypothetical protein